MFAQGVTEENRQRFAAACAWVLGGERTGGGIGTLREKTLHAVLKQYMDPYDGNHETKVGPFVADIVGEHGIVEIQTRNFSQMKKKLTAFLEVADVTVVYPIPHIKWLSWIDTETGAASPKRKSPKRGTFYDAFWELGWLKPLLPHPRLRFHLILLDVEEYRYLNGWGRGGKRGSTRCDRVPVALADERTVGAADGFAGLFPEGLPDRFTSRDFAEAAGIPRESATGGLNILLAAGAVARVGKQGRMFLYERTKPLDL